MAIPQLIGRDLLILPPNEVDLDWQEEILRPTASADWTNGVLTTRALTPKDVSEMPLEWACFNRQELRDVQEFVAAREGRYNDFWMPSFRNDLIIYPPEVDQEFYQFRVRDTSAILGMIASGRRWLLGYTMDSWAAYQLSLSAPVEAVTPGFWLVSHDNQYGDWANKHSGIHWKFSWLYRARLATDEVEEEYLTPEITMVRTSVIEVHE